MARRASGEIYQVDLIAALFGGFMISWLVSAQETEFQVYSKPLKFATLEMRVIGDWTPPGSPTISIWKSAVSLSSIEESGCIGTDLARDLIGGVSRYQDCTSEEAEKLNASVTSSKSGIRYWANVLDPCTASSGGNPFPKTQSINSNFALDAQMPDFLSPLGAVHRTFRPSEFATSSSIPYFFYYSTYTLDNCTTRLGRNQVAQLFLVSDFNPQSEASVLFPIKSGDGALHLSGILKGSTATLRKTVFTNNISIVNSVGEIEVDDSIVLLNPKLQALLCVYVEGTETCYGGEHELSNGGAPGLTLNRDVDVW